MKMPSWKKPAWKGFRRKQTVTEETVETPVDAPDMPEETELEGTQYIPSIEDTPEPERPKKKRKKRTKQPLGKRLVQLVKRLAAFVVRKLRAAFAAKNLRAWDKVKNAVILSLIVLHLAALVGFGIIRVQHAMVQRETRAQMDTMLARKGILCGTSVYNALENCPQGYVLHADSSIEKSLARVLLSGTVTTQAVENGTAWAGDNGTVEWLQSGELHADVRLPQLIVPQNIEDASDIVHDLLEQAGIKVTADQVAVTENEDGYSVSVSQKLEGVSLLGCSMNFSIGKGNYFDISGRWCTGDAQPMDIRALKSYTAQKAMFAFLASDTVVAQIISVQPAYILSEKSGGRFAAAPCWRFSTDSGDYVLKIETGDVVASTDVESMQDDSDETDPADAAENMN